MLSFMILAAGRSSRFGDLKAVYRVNGKSFLELILENVSSPDHAGEILVGTGFNKEAVIRELKRISFKGRVVVNDDYDRGQFSTLQVCVRASSPESSGFVMILADHPFVRRDTYRLLAHEFRRTGCGRILIPRYRGKKGHPVFFPSALKNEILALPPEKSARNIIKNHTDTVEIVETNDPFILADIDNKEMLKRYLKEI